jgi:hypothetical protein
MAALFSLFGGGGGAAPEKMGCALRTTTQVFVTETNVHKIEDHNHSNPNHKQELQTWEELFFFFEN